MRGHMSTVCGWRVCVLRCRRGVSLIGQTAGCRGGIGTYHHTACAYELHTSDLCVTLVSKSHQLYATSKLYDSPHHLLPPCAQIRSGVDAGRTPWAHKPMGVSAEAASVTYVAPRDTVPP